MTSRRRAWHPTSLITTSHISSTSAGGCPGRDCSLAGLCPTLRDQLAIQWSFQMGFGHEVWEVTGVHLSVLKFAVISRCPDLLRCDASHTMSSSIRLISVSFFDAPQPARARIKTASWGRAGRIAPHFVTVIMARVDRRTTWQVIAAGLAVCCVWRLARGRRKVAQIFHRWCR